LIPKPGFGLLAVSVTFSFPGCVHYAQRACRFSGVYEARLRQEKKEMPFGWASLSVFSIRSFTEPDFRNQPMMSNPV
jgi:hypothetical protein